MVSSTAAMAGTLTRLLVTKQRDVALMLDPHALFPLPSV